MIDDVAGFVRSDADNSHVLDCEQRITELKTSAGGDDPGRIEGGVAALTADLGADPAYVAYGWRVYAERQRENARYLDDAVRTLGVQKGVLVQALVQDPTSAAAGDYLTLEKQETAVLSTPDLDRAKTVIGLIDAAVAKGGLSASYELARANTAKAGAAETHL